VPACFPANPRTTVSLATTVVIVNFNGGEHLLRCLSALGCQSMPHRTLIVDNASTDGSARRAFDAFPHVSIVPLRRNVGFARAVNLAASRIDDPTGIMVTLNPDTVPATDFLEQLIRPLRDNLAIAATAGTLVFASSPAVVASAGISVHRNGVALDARLGETVVPGDPYPVFGASGGAAAFRLTTFRSIGGFCPSFFLYLEDVDLAWRLRLAGHEVLAVPTAIAAHAYSASSVEGSPLKRRLLARNRIWTLARCLPSEVWNRDRRHIVAFDMAALGFGLIRRDVAALRGRAEGIAGMPVRLRERALIQTSATAQHEDIARWIEEPLSGARLLRLRRLTGELAVTSMH
jgi:GT2 family glycosyltransferase